MSQGRWFDIDSPDWGKALAGLEHDVYHLPGYAALEAHRMGGEARLFVYDERNLRFLLPLVLRPIDDSDKFDAISPYGYPGPIVSSGARANFIERASRALIDALSDLRLVSAFVRMHPLLSPDPDHLDVAGTLVKHGQTVSIDLRQPEDVMWTAIRAGHRTEIRHSSEKGLAFFADPAWSKLDEFLSLYTATMKRLSAADEYFFDRAYFTGLRGLPAAQIQLACVTHEETLLAAGVFTEVEGLVQYHLSASQQIDRRLQPTKLLLDQVRRWAAGQGHHTLHLGGGVGGRKDGLFGFKAGFSKSRHDFFTWRLVPDATAYERLCASTGVEAGLGFFPAYRQKPL
ncbi:MAG: GNAT family N-acetyltransferase [Acidobacteriota bacterium]|nr:GNAT family N-acetyltransferase [Acidobacteriota bacterium]